MDESAVGQKCPSYGGFARPTAERYAFYVSHGGAALVRTGGVVSGRYPAAVWLGCALEAKSVELAEAGSKQGAAGMFWLSAMPWSGGLCLRFRNRRHSAADPHISTANVPRVMNAPAVALRAPWEFLPAMLSRITPIRTTTREMTRPEIGQPRGPRWRARSAGRRWAPSNRSPFRWREPVRCLVRSCAVCSWSSACFSAACVRHACCSAECRCRCRARVFFCSARSWGCRRR